MIAKKGKLTFVLDWPTKNIVNESNISEQDPQESFTLKHSRLDSKSITLGYLDKLGFYRTT